MLGFACRRGTSSCLAKKKYPRRRRARCVARLSPGSLCCSATTGGLRNSGLRPSDSRRPFSPLRLALLDDAEGKRKTDRTTTANGFASRLRFRSVCFVSPSCSAEQRSAAGGSRRGLFEGRSPEFRSRPASRVAQGSRQRRPRNAGVAFSLATFFWRPKRKYARASGAERSG